MHGFTGTYGKTRARAAQDPETGKLPMLKTPGMLSPEAYYAKSDSFRKLVRNKSSVLMGDNRYSTFETQSVREFRDWNPRRPDTPPTKETVMKWYHDASDRVAAWRVDEIEEAMRMKINQRTRGGSFVLRQAFKFFDRDGSGGINPLELRNGLDLFGLQFEEHEILALMARYDNSYDGEIDYYEFIQNLLEPDWMTSSKVKHIAERIEENINRDNESFDSLLHRLSCQKILTNQQVYSIFETLDVDRSSSLSVVELKHLFEMLELPERITSQIAVVFDRIDKDKSGSIEMEEFCAWLRSMCL